MDFAFVPGLTDYEKLLQRAMKSRKNTTLINQAGLATIADFLQSLGTNSQQADNLVLGGHASDQSFTIPFDSFTQVPTNSNGRDYEMLQAVDQAGTIHISPAVRTATTNCYIKGCHIGADSGLPYLQLFKSALDNPQQLNAPKFFHDLKEDSVNGVLEYMRVEYTVSSPLGFDSTKDLVDEFRNRNFQQGVEAGGTQVTVPDKWKDWISPKLKLRPAVSDEKPFDILSMIVPQAGGLRSISRKTGLCTARHHTFVPILSMGTQTIPPDIPGKMALLKPRLQADPRENSGFPLHARFGFSTLDEWIAGFDWTPVADEADPNNKKIIFLGQFYVYGVKLPIMKSGTNQLIYNYYPTHGTPVMNFLEDNAKFVLFGSV